MCFIPKSHPYEAGIMSTAGMFTLCHMYLSVCVPCSLTNVGGILSKDHTYMLTLHYGFVPRPLKPGNEAASCPSIP